MTTNRISPLIIASPLQPTTTSLHFTSPHLTSPHLTIHSSSSFPTHQRQIQQQNAFLTLTSHPEVRSPKHVLNRIAAAPQQWTFPPTQLRRRPRARPPRAQVSSLPPSIRPDNTSLLYQMARLIRVHISILCRCIKCESKLIVSSLPALAIIPPKSRRRTDPTSTYSAALKILLDHLIIMAYSVCRTPKNPRPLRHVSNSFNLTTS